ncbi:MAG: hypothetical protein HY958_05515 [Bacteroidia bacterium]|nr:hypothetical protein [Bacteroidia bacterium]
MKKYVLLSGIFLVLFIITSFTILKDSFSKDKHPTDIRDCLVKVKSTWGDPCPGCTSYRESYKVRFVNDCEVNLDFKIAVQNKNKTLKIFEKENFGPNDSIDVYSCEGTGKVFKYVRKAGDREIELPSNMEITKKNPK